MKKLSLSKSLLLLALAVGLIGLGTPVVRADEHTKSNEVYWTLDGCWINIDIGSEGGSVNYDLGTVSNYSPEDFINNDGSPQGVQVTTNCNQGYTVNVQATQFDLPSTAGGDPANHPISPGTAIQDFAIKDKSPDSLITSYSYFNGLDSPKQLADVSNAATTNLDMVYQYRLDPNDVPGDYRVYLTYTVSTG